MGDSARVPYGARSRDTLKKYVQQNITWLEKQNCKAIVVACNSASTVLDEVSANVPIYGVIEPGANYALSKTKNKSIGVIATRATVEQRSYVTAIDKLSQGCKIFQQACPLLVPLVEESWDEDPLTNLIVYRYLSPLASAGIDTLILGCTHYPILKPSIMKVMGPEVQLIESAHPIVKQLQLAFQSGKLTPENYSNDQNWDIYVTDLSSNFAAMTQRILRLAQAPLIEKISLEELSKD